jgi:protein-L-isoaspartate(D-aspartate) O-methyltransferase
MIEQQIRPWEVIDQRVLDVLNTVPREAFVPGGYRGLAYADIDVPMGHGEVMLAPKIEAKLLQALAVQPTDRVLEVGTGSGYAAAVLAELAAEVFTVERHETLARSAAARLRRLGYARVEVRCGDGTLGWEDHAPYQGILVSAGAPEVPRALERQLAVGGRLVLPVGPSRYDQTLVRVTRVEAERWERDPFGAVRFVPLVGREGWRTDEDAEGGR